MTTVAPPPPPTPPPQPPLSSPVVVVPNPPATLAELSLGMTLKAAMVEQLGQGMFQVRTSLGTMEIMTSVPLPKDAALVLKLLTLTPQTQLQLISINGRPPYVELRQQAGTPPFGKAHSAGSPPAGTAARAGSVATVDLAVGAKVAATLLKPAGGAAGASRGAAGAMTAQGGAGVPSPTAKGGATAAGTQAAAGKAGGQAAAAARGATGGQGAAAVKPGAQVRAAVGKAGAPAAMAKAAAKPGAARAGPGAAGGAAARGGGAILPAGSQMNVRIVSLLPAGSSAAPASAAAPGGTNVLAAGQTLSGTVSGATASGQPIVQTPAGALALATHTTFPRGAAVTFQVLDNPLLPETPPGGRLSTSPGEMILSRRWPKLEEAMQTLREVNPAMVQQFIASALPQANTQLAANILFFLTALRGGDISGWMGDGALRIIQRIKPGLAEQLKNDFGRMSRLAEEPIGGDWRIALIPFFTDNDGLERIRMLTRKAGGGEEDEEAQEGTRFVIDLDLSRLGHMQLDGLVRDANKRLDLIVRTDSPLDPLIRDGIRGIFNDAGELTGMTGGVSFQATPPNFVEIPAGDPAEEHLGLIV